MGKVEITLPSPSERQREFLCDSHKYIAFGGARGGGKSFAVRLKATLLCLNYPGIRIMIVRRTYPELRQNHIIPLKALVGGAASFRESTKDMTFTSGSVKHLARTTASIPQPNAHMAAPRMPSQKFSIFRSGE